MKYWPHKELFSVLSQTHRATIFQFCMYAINSSYLNHSKNKTLACCCSHNKFLVRTCHEFTRTGFSVCNSFLLINVIIVRVPWCEYIEWIPVSSLCYELNVSTFFIFIFLSFFYNSSYMNLSRHYKKKCYTMYISNIYRGERGWEWRRRETALGKKGGRQFREKKNEHRKRENAVKGIA